MVKNQGLWSKAREELKTPSNSQILESLEAKVPTPVSPSDYYTSNQYFDYNSMTETEPKPLSKPLLNT